MIPSYPQQLPPQDTQLLGSANTLSVIFYNLLRILWLRTGGADGIAEEVDTGLTASGQVLAADYNEVLHSGSFVVLGNLQPGQEQTVFNGSGSALSIHAFGSGQIDGGAAYSLANNKTQLFTCTALLANGYPAFRSTQWG